MGRKRKSKSKKNKMLRNDLYGGFLNVFAIILMIMLVIADTSPFLRAIANTLKGVFGVCAYLIPIVISLIGIHLILSEVNVKKTKELLKGLLCITLLGTVVALFVSASSSYTLFANPLDYVQNTFNLASSGEIAYGLLGGTIANVSVYIMGALISQIVFTLLTIIVLLFIFDISLRQMAYFIYNVFAFIVNGIYTIGQTLFRKDDEIQISGINSNIGKRKPKKEIIEEEMPSKNKVTSNEVINNLKSNKLEQVEFDFEKLGGQISEEQQKASEKRDDFFKKQIEKKEDKNVKEVLTIDHAKLEKEDNYEFPSIKILGVNKAADKNVDKKAIHATAVKLQKTLASFGVEAKVINITKGPTVTRYELAPSTGVKVSKIVNLADDIALNLAAKSIRIEAPIPGKAAVGIELPNAEPEAVYIREIIESKTFTEHSSNLAFSLGKDAAGDTIVGDIAKMPHVLIAGSTGSGKSVCINSLIVSLLYKSKPSDVKMILIDPKMVELSGYNGIPHLLIPVVTDPKKAAGALNWAVNEMVNRYNIFAAKGVKDIKGYNKIIEAEGEGIAKLPQIVIIIDELADLMMVAPNDVEDAICRLAQMARAAGMHLVIATQRPSVDVITGIIKANVPSRIAFTVSSNVDSRTILDSAGAEKLLGKGDMLYFPVGATKPQRIQGTWISEKEIETIVDSIKKDDVVNYDDAIIESIEKTQVGKGKSNGSSKDPDSIEDAPDEDPLLNEAIDLVVDMGQASASMLQRRFKIGYSRAGRIIDQMEERGLISGHEGSKPRHLLVTKEQWLELKFQMQQSMRNEENNN